MDKRIEDIINSGLIEEYLFGTLDKSEIARVEQLVQDHPELHQHLLEVQEVLWGMADEMAIEPPPSVKAKILAEIEADHAMSDVTGPARNWKGWAAAGLIALTAAVGGLLLSSDHAQEMRALESNLKQCQRFQQEAVAATTKMEALLSPSTSIQVLASATKDLDIVAFANKNAETLALTMRAMPIIPQGKCLQLWGDKDGEMVSIAVLSSAADYMKTPLTIDPSFASINITLEDAGPDGNGSDHATVSALVASATI